MVSGPTTAFQTGVHGSRPAASAGCVLYSCTTHGLVYRSDGSSWATFITLAAGGAATDTIYDAKGDLAVGTGADTAAKLSVGTNGYRLTADSSQSTGLKWEAVAAPTFVGWRVYNSGNVSLSTASETLITFDSERYDSDTFHDTGSNTGRATVPSGKGGKYHVGFNVRLTNTPGDPSYALIQHVTSGPTTTTVALAFIANNGSIPAVQISADWAAAVGDYFQCYVFALTASKNALNSTAYSPEFWGHLIGV